MGFSLGTLTPYVEQNEALLVASSVLGAKTQSLIQAQGNVMTGVKSKETINIMDTNAIFQAGGTCGFTTSGTTSVTQREVEVGKIKVMESICPKDLEAYYLQKALPAGSSYDTIAFAREYTDRKAAKIAAQLEKAVWQGDKNSVDVNLNKFDGIIELVKDASTAIVNANTATYYSGAPATAIDDTTVVNIFDAVYKAIPAEVVDKDDVKIFCGMDVFRTLTIKIKNANLFHYQVDAAPNTSFFLPGTQIEVVGTPGLNGTNKVYAMRLSNLFLGVDLMHDEDRFELFFAKEADEVRFVSEFKIGVNFAFPQEIVKFEV